MLLIEAALCYNKAPLCSGVSTIANYGDSASWAQEFLLGAIAIVSFHS